MKNHSGQRSQKIIHDFFDPAPSSTGVSMKTWLKQHQDAWKNLHQLKKVKLPSYTRTFLESRVAQENHARKRLKLKQDTHVTTKDMVNYLRHSCDEYYQHIRQWRGHDPSDALYRLYKWYVLSLIGQAYPYLYDETLRQKQTLVKSAEQYEWMTEAMTQFLYRRQEFIANTPPLRAPILDSQTLIDTPPQNLNPEPDHPQMDPGRSL